MNYHLNIATLFLREIFQSLKTKLMLASMFLLFRQNNIWEIEILAFKTLKKTLLSVILNHMMI